jgi:hypothetical protein
MISLTKIGLYCAGGPEPVHGEDQYIGILNNILVLDLNVFVAMETSSKEKAKSLKPV